MNLKKPKKKTFSTPKKISKNKTKKRKHDYFARRKSKKKDPVLYLLSFCGMFVVGGRGKNLSPVLWLWHVPLYF